jgi:uncharacterized membrane protein
VSWTDEQVDRAIGVLLRVGVTLAAIVVFAASVWLHAGSSTNVDVFRAFHGEPDELRSPTAVVGGAIHGHAAAWVQLGLLLLIATPVVRVAYSVVAFALQRDRTYVVITLIVLAVLLYGLW